MTINIDSFQHRDGTAHTPDGPIGCPGCGRLRSNATKVPSTGPHYAPTPKTPDRPWTAYLSGSVLRNSQDKKIERFSSHQDALFAIENARIAYIIREIPTPCSNCKKIAHVTAGDRARGRWDCYSCGTINRWAT